MATRIPWRKPSDALDGLTPNEWLAQEYPREPHNKVLAQRLMGLLGLDITDDSMYARVRRRACDLDLVKTDEARRQAHQERGEKLRLPLAPLVTKFKDMPAAESKRFVVTADWHFPYYDERLAHRMFTLCQYWKPPIKDHFCAGDFWDFYQLSRYFKAQGVEDGRLVEDDLGDAEELLGAMAEWFDRMIILLGNHENRLYSGSLLKQIGQDRLQRMWNVVPEKMEFSKWPKMVVNDEWRITHPGGAWISGLQQARRLAAIHEQHILMGHAHCQMRGQGWSSNRLVADIGGMFDEQKIEYVSVGPDSTRPAWLPGFVIVDDGKAHLFNLPWTDWEFYRRALDIPVGWR